MTLHQRFQHGERVELFTPRKDKTTGVLYVRENDVQRVFPGANLFKVNGVVLYYLEDENEEDASLPRSTSLHTNSGKQYDPSSTKELDLTVSTPSLQYTLPTLTDAHVCTPLQPFLTPTLISSNVATIQQASIAGPMAMLSTMALNITQLQQQLERSTDQQPVHRQQQMQKLIDMVAQQNGMVVKMIEVLREQEASKESEEQMLKMQQETIDRLIDNQQRVDEFLVQNYELHEPGSVLGKVRYCQRSIITPDPSVAAVAAHVAVLADSGLKDVMDGVKSISESTINAVDVSINILETKLGDVEVANGLKRTALNAQENNTIFEHLTALEGSDLRRLDTFLRNNDNDKILGNLYRIPTKQGHIRWVCFEHYQEKYRATALSSFVQSVESAGGSYDSHLGRVTIKLKSGATAKDFFRRLATQTLAVQSLDVTLDWDFGSAGLVTLVDMVSKSNVKAVKLDLQDNCTSNATTTSLQPGKGSYHSFQRFMAPELQLLWMDQQGGQKSIDKHHLTMFLSETVRKSGAVLEVLILRSNSVMGVDIGPEDSSAIPLLRGHEGAPVKPISNVPHLSALTHLDLSMAFTYPSDQHLSTVLPRLDLVHFGFNPYSRELLQHCNIASLKSLAIKVPSAIDLKVLLDMMDDKTPART
ncbi:hypothetical protein F5H01DRAFT_408470 [Linnemannia elongata]|nr:hypothetical protein F5H01DRAFT_408470 [Linnemannia elongata]